MNIYGIIIITTLVIDYLLNLLSDILTLSKMDNIVPAEMTDVYDADRYASSQSYTKTKMRFGFIATTFNLITLLLFWKFGGFAWLDININATAWSPIWRGLTYIGVLILAKSILDLPFSIYSTFVIEERFGFNKTTVKTFITDMIKGTILGLAIGGPILAGILAFFTYAGPWAWAYAWLAVSIISLILQVVAPIWIMPLFNKFTPIDDGKLKDKILKYVERVQFKIAGIFIIDGSKRSAKSNAFFTGLGKYRRIALFDTLVESQSTDELLAILAHEIGHNKKGHIIKSTVISILHTGILFYILSIVLAKTGLFEVFGTMPSVHTGLIFFGLLYTPVEMLLSLAMNAYSRYNERQADTFAVETTGMPDQMITALKKLSAHNLSNLRPHPFEVLMHHSHPPVLQRIKFIKELKVNLD
ncbi:M48 family metallopeptidase [bacterium]|nr:M48 family metallopeptidase [bacterium]